MYIKQRISSVQLTADLRYLRIHALPLLHTQLTHIRTLALITSARMKNKNATQLKIQRFNWILYIWLIWDINNKVIAVITDNARNFVNVISLISSDIKINSVICAAHSFQLAINHSLKQDNIQLLVENCSTLLLFKYDLWYIRYKNT